MFKNTLFFLLFCFFSCNDLQKKTIIVKSFLSDSTYHLEKVNFDQFKKSFDSFYKDNHGRFFISAIMHGKSSLNTTPILIQIPPLDSTTFSREGQYLIDEENVICVFDNSDGGNFVPLKNVNPSSFRIFHNIFGGRDAAHVFFQNQPLPGLDPKNVSVYSSIQNCSNCDGYLKTGNITYFDSRIVGDSTTKIPSEFHFVE